MAGDASSLTGSSRRLLATFSANGITCEVADGQLNIIRYKTKDGEWRLLKGMVSEKLPLFSKQICDDKWWCFRQLQEWQLPTPYTRRITTEEQLSEFIAEYTAAVVKPRNGAHGHGVSMNVTSSSKSPGAIRLAKKYSTQVLAQQQLDGTDIRLLVVGDAVISAVERRPAMVTGDGIHTIYDLILQENKKPERGQLGIDTLVAISLPAAKQFLTGKDIRRIPSHNEVVRVVGPSNQSMGGTVHDITNQIPEAMREDTLRLVRSLCMPIAGVDCILTADGYFFLEINASPGIAIHDDPRLGIQSGCFTAYMQLLHEDTWWR